MPIILDTTDIPNEENLKFTNINSIIEKITVAIQPNFFNRIHIEDFDKKIKKELDKTVISTKHSNTPVIPNFFLKAKAPKGEADITKR